MAGTVTKGLVEGTFMADQRAVCSWSGGKDSCFALYKAFSEGAKVTHIVNFVSHEYKRVRFHGVPAGIIRAQADALGIALVQKETTPKGYEAEFKEAVAALAQNGVKSIICGDIHLADSRDWIEKLSAEIGLKVIEPLWGRSSKEVLAEFIDSGFEATIVSAQADIFDKSWVGRKIDADFLRDIMMIKGIDVCGENGEYHTLVRNGPIFTKRIEIEDCEVVRKSTHWFLDILSYDLIAKE